MNKKLYKSHDKKICGVCGGLAEFFGMDASMVRIGFTLAIFFAGVPLWIYFICALVMPNPPVDDFNTTNQNGYNQYNN